MPEKKYPHELMLGIGASFIGTQVYDGCHWYIFDTKKEPKMEQQLIQLQQQIINLGGIVNDILKIKQFRDGTKIVSIDREVYNEIATEYMNKVYAAYPILRRKTALNIEGIREKEIKLFSNYISKQKENNVDVCLYKTTNPGERKQTLVIHEIEKHTGKHNLYKKELYGFYLTEEDIEDVNKELAKSNKKIAAITQNELINRYDGVRYTLDITEADFIRR